jgi:hypothetical protein
MNQSLKNQLTKLILDTRLPWIKCLPIALLRIRALGRTLASPPMKCFLGFLTLALLLMHLPLQPKTISSKLYTWIVLYLAFSQEEGVVNIGCST